MDHPRIHGEKLGHIEFCYDIPGSPPHTRGKDRIKTIKAEIDVDHPRIHGEKTMQNPKTGGNRGSPPHTRGKDVINWDNVGPRRITPAYTGKRQTITQAQAER